MSARSLPLMCVLSISLLFSACAAKQTSDAIARSRSMFHELSSGQVKGIMDQTAPEERSPQAVAGLLEASKLIPPGKPTSILTLRNHYKIYSNIIIIDLSEEYFFPNDKQLVFDTMFRYDSRSTSPELLAARLRAA
jgi:hypothetical protein